MTPVPVAIHRWFERGEGWAYDPLCGERLGPEVVAALNTAFDPRLKRPGMGPFVLLIPGSEEVWLGRVDPESEALDPRTRTGDTPVLRAVLLPYAPDGAVEDRILADLLGLSPRRPGPDLSLSLEVSFDDVVAPEPAPKPRREGGIPIYLPVMVSLALAAMIGGFLWWRPWQGILRGVSQGPPYVQKMRTLLDHWGVSPGEESGTGDVVQAFFETVARPAWAASLDPAEHPYHAFVLRLPAAPVTVENPDDEESVRQGLLRLLEQLGDSRSATAPPSTEELLDRLERTLTYERWYRASGKWERYTKIDIRPAKRVVDLVGRFRRPEPELSTAAEVMRRLLVRWREASLDPEDARRHPDLVATAFFRLLCHRDFTAGQLRPDHPDTVFVDRLPEEPVGDGRPLMTPAELRTALHRLLSSLDRSFDPRTPVNQDLGHCLKRVAEEMDFARWRQSEGKGKRKYPDEKQPIDAGVAAFAARFK
jgi:hypothetical protein